MKTKKTNSWKKRLLWGIGIFFLLVVSGYFIAKNLMRRASFWESSIKAFEVKDKKSFPALNGIVFTGSSSINFWSSLEKDMEPLPAINRGFGGAYMSHLNHYASRIILPYKPKIVLVYCGENDIADFVTPNEVLKSFQELVVKIHEQLPQTKIYYISIKPPILRSAWRSKFEETNEKMRLFAAKENLVYYIDTATAMLGNNGEVKSELFMWDCIHINDEGYKIWTSIIKPKIMKEWSKEEK